MENAANADPPGQVIRICELGREVALRHWSRTHNVRLAQLCEKLFEAYWKWLHDLTLNQAQPRQKSTEQGHSSSTSSSSIDCVQHCLQRMLEVGEIMMAVYSHYWEPYNLGMAVLSHRMAALYRLRNDEISPERALNYFTLAGNIWKLHGDVECMKYYEILSSKALQRLVSIRDALSKKETVDSTLM